jgi:transcriptional regulator with XRE-family HTH domain
MPKNVQDWEELIGVRVRRLRLDRDMRQEEVAAQAGLSVPTITRLERGRGSSLQTLIKVLQVLGEESWLEQLAPRLASSPAVQQEPSTRQRARRRSAKPKQKLKPGPKPKSKPGPKPKAKAKPGSKPKQKPGPKPKSGSKGKTKKS